MILIPKKVQNTLRTATNNPASFRFALDGVLAGSAVAIATKNHSLLAARLGATDYQLSLIQFLPQMLILFTLIPGGLFTDSLHNKQRMAIAMLAAGAFGLLMCGLSPFAAGFSIPFFLIFLSLTGGAMSLYNVAWQSFFPEVIEEHTRNQVFTQRTRVTVSVSIVTSLFVGAVLANIMNLDKKIIAHQGFYAGSVLLLLLAAFNFRKIRAVQPAKPKRITLFGIKKAVQTLLRNKQFLIFTGAALFFHTTWHIDWTLYFIGQFHYLGMNEFMLGLAMVGTTAAQLATLKFWSRMNERRGVVLPLTFGIVGLSLCPVSMIVAVSLPASIGPYAFLALHTISHLTFASVTLNLYQCLLHTADTEHRGFFMSAYSTCICLSNAIMPVVGVALYHALGGDLNGFRITFGIIFLLRIAAAGVWLLSWKELSR